MSTAGGDIPDFPMAKPPLITRILLGLAALVALVSLVPAQAPQGLPDESVPQGSQSTGALEARPGTGRQPEFPIPNIREYKPRSTLVVPQHPIPRARFPVIDFHSHQPSPISSAEFDALVTSMDPLNLRVLVNASGQSGESLQRAMSAIRSSPHRDRMMMFTDINFRNVGPGFGQRAARQLEADVRAGALGLGEITKEAGMTYRKADGSRLRIDDPELDPIWETAGRLNIPVFIHTAEPQEFFQPIDYTNERWLELALFPDRRQYLNKNVSFNLLMSERDDLFKKHPKTRFISAHFGWHGHDLGRAGRLLDEHPNVTLELAAILYDLGRQPRTAHDFFVKYQDRILFGKDTYAPSEFPYYWRVLETRDEYFDYYRDYHAYWQLYGMQLPDAVLRKVYQDNALRITPGLPR